MRVSNHQEKLMRKTLLTMAALSLSSMAFAGDDAAAKFDTLDSDRNGSLSPTEFAAAKSAHTFEAVDRNGDGKIDRDEFSGSKQE
jgi:Ca2+-binding EF-hand superfamily protein